MAKIDCDDNSTQAAIRPQRRPTDKQPAASGAVCFFEMELWILDP